MSEDNGAPALFTKDDTTGDYVEYTPPKPPSFHESLPEDIRDSEHLKDVEGAPDLARYYVDLKSNYLKPPDAADGYEWQRPDGSHIDDSMLSQFRQIAFENGLNQKQFEGLMNLETQRHADAIKAIDGQIQATQDESSAHLKKEWGNDYDKNLDAAKSVFRNDSLVSEDFRKFAEDTRFGDNPEVIKFFYNISKLISEDAFQKPGTGNAESGDIQRGIDGRPLLKFPSMEKK